MPIQTDALGALQESIEPLCDRLVNHAMYREMTTQPHVRLFMQSHVFAVWDFMSLLKVLQRELTCIDIPWLPSPNPETRRLVNEIVLGEESDEYGKGYLSHFELYLQAMRQAGADTQPISAFIEALRNGTSVSKALTTAGIPPHAAEFVRATFDTIALGKPHVTAAVFTFGREDLIPGMFRGIVRDLSAHAGGLELFSYYLDRHIEVDGDTHGPMALRMVEQLCGDNSEYWIEAQNAAKAALEQRLRLWDGILSELE